MLLCPLSLCRQQFNCQRCGERVSARRATRSAQTRRGGGELQTPLGLTVQIKWRHLGWTLALTHSASTELVSAFLSKPTLKWRTSPRISASGFIVISSMRSRATPQREVKEFTPQSCRERQKLTLSPRPCPSGGVFLRDVSCYFSVLEDGRPRDKLECGFFPHFLHCFVMSLVHLIDI